VKKNKSIDPNIRTKSSRIKPLVSVVITTFNRKEELQVAVKSCLEQDYPNIEVVVIDDCSDFCVCKIPLLLENPKIKCFRNDSRMGLCYSRNRGFEKSSGDFVNFLDDDDICLPTKLSKQVNLFNTSIVKKLGVVLCNVKYAYKHSSKSMILKNAFRGFLGRTLCLRSCIWGTNNALFRRKVLERYNFDPYLMTHEEYDLFLRIGQEYSYDYVSETLCQVNVSENGLGYNFKRRLVATPYFFTKHCKLFLSYGLGVITFNLARFLFLELMYLVCLIFGSRVYGAFFGFSSRRNQIG
jgi:glycosyltransferase involved in cell wall biosynthesis